MTEAAPRTSVVHTIAGLKDRAGGVARSVPGLCEALATEGCRTVLVSQQPGDVAPGSLLLPNAKLVETRLLPGHDWERFRFSYTPNLDRRLRLIFGEVQPTVVHDHGVWLHMNHATASATRRLGIKRVVSPRGMLEGWSLSYRGWKKRLAWGAYQQADLLSASAFSATSRMEASNIRSLGFAQPIAVIPNGVELPPPRSRVREPSPWRTVVFMSRLHPKKGLRDLVEAWSHVVRDDWRLVVAGPDEDGYGRTIEGAVAAAGLSGSVSFPGAVAGQAKRELLQSADLFVLPSYSENFGIVVAEALASSLPVITTKATPWEEVESSRCGWWIETGAAPLQNALAVAMGLTDEQREAMGARGRGLVKARFSWQSIAQEHIALYRWLAEDAPAPSCLVE